MLDLDIRSSRPECATMIPIETQSSANFIRHGSVRSIDYYSSTIKAVMRSLA